MTTSRREHHVLGTRAGHTTLTQRFRFTGEGARAEALERVLTDAPLVGAGSIFGDRPGAEESGGPSRTLRGFSPAPGFRFDVELTPQGAGVFVVRFSQPERSRPYLEGEFVWTVTGADDGVAFDEQINTEEAMRIARRPLSGSGPSLRRWLFFRVGHQQVMARAAQNIASLLHR